MLGLKVGHLIYAKGNEDPARHSVRGADVEIICHALELDQPPQALLSSVGALARLIAQSADR